MKENENAFSKQQQEFTAMVVRNLPWLEGTQMQYFIGQPHYLREVLYKLPLQFWKPLWENYYNWAWGIPKIPWNDIVMPNYTDGFSELVVVLKQLSPDRVYQKMKEEKYLLEGSIPDSFNSDLKHCFQHKERSGFNYAVWVEPDYTFVPVSKTETAEQISKRLPSTMNLLEKLIWDHFIRFMQFKKPDNEIGMCCPANLTNDNLNFAGVAGRNDDPNCEWIYQATHLHVKNIAVRRIAGPIGCYEKR